MHGMGRNWATGFLLFLVAYFVYHAFNGDNGINALRALQKQEQELMLVATEVQAEKEYLASKTQALSRSSIDPDMLEEQVREKLGFTHADEVIIMLQ